MFIKVAVISIISIFCFAEALATCLATLAI